MDDRSPPIIIKRIRKNRHHEAHGGSWKVAYADFVTAMMAFFLLLWLLSMVSTEKRIAVSEYFKNYTIFQEISAGGSRSFMNASTHVFDKKGTGPAKITKASAQEIVATEEMVKKLKSAVDEKLKSMSNQVLVDVVDDGVRIQIVDADGSLMFQLGSAEPTERARAIIKLVSENIRERTNRIVIEGHTDAAPFRGAQTTNWELSTSRASAARRELEKNGVDPNQIAKVVGYADQELLIKENPKDPRNRRISITLLHAKS
ncbi:MAG: OmpA family protein [Deltaproteobacteria bacterium]|nr:OmpA family protein [Deltaproteobacteria bacterium]